MKLELKATDWNSAFPIGPYTWTVMKRLQEDRNTMAVFLGPPRVGKSTADNSNGENISISRPFRARDVTFLPYDYLGALSRGTAGDVVNFDEPGAEWGNRQFASIENKMLNATHVTFGSKLINVGWAVPVLKMQDVQARMLVNYVFTFRDTGPRGQSYFYKNWVNAYTGKVGRTGLGMCWWGRAWQDRPEEQKEYEEMKKQYQDRKYARYYTEFAKADEDNADKLSSQNALVDKAFSTIRSNPGPYLNSRGSVDPDMVRREFHLPSRDADYVAKVITRERRQARDQGRLSKK